MSTVPPRKNRRSGKKRKRKAQTPKPERLLWAFEQWSAKLSAERKARLIKRARTCAPEDQVLETCGLLLADAHRKFDCLYYSTCLTNAAIGKWNGFSCRSCPLATGLAPDPSAPWPKRYNDT